VVQAVHSPVGEHFLFSKSQQLDSGNDREDDDEVEVDGGTLISEMAARATPIIKTSDFMGRRGPTSIRG